MARTRSVRRTAGATAVVVLAGAMTALAPVAPAAAKHSFNGLHWPTDGRGIAVINQAGPQYSDFIAHTVNKWRMASAAHRTARFPQGPIALRYEYGGPGKCMDGYTPPKGEIVVCARNRIVKSEPGVVGLAVLRPQGGHIRSAQVYFDPAQPRGLWMTILCHEVGHALGLGHREAGTRSCMQTPARASASDPDGHDADHLRAVHDHLD